MARPKKKPVLKNSLRGVASGQSGVVAIITAFAILAFMGFGALSIDLGHLYMAKGELQRAVDAGALAGAWGLFFPETSSPPQCPQAQTIGTSMCTANNVDGSPPTVSAIDTGTWNWTANSFSTSCISSNANFTNAVRITANSANISLVFLGILGMAPFQVQATATAAKGWLNSLNPGFGWVMCINQANVQTAPAYTTISISPSSQDTGAWYTKAPANPTSNIIDNYLNDPSQVPGLNIGDTVNFNNGAFENVLRNINNNWIGKTVIMPVVQNLQSTSSAPVICFTAFQITSVGLSGQKYVRGLALKLNEAPPNAGTPGGYLPGGLLTATRLVN